MLLAQPQQLIEFLRSLFTPETIFKIKAVFLVLTAVFLLIGIWLLIRLRTIPIVTEKIFDFLFPPQVVKRRRKVKAWRRIQKRVKEGGEANLKMAIIEADKILDDLLDQMGYQGQTVAEKLKQLTSAQLSNLDAVWQAHKIRNQITHQPDFRISPREAEIIITIYEQAFRELRLI